MHDIRRYSLRNSFLFTRVAEGLRILKTEDSFHIYVHSTLRNRYAQIYRFLHAICMWNERFNSKTDSWSWQPLFARSSTFVTASSTVIHAEPFTAHCTVFNGSWNREIIFNISLIRSRLSEHWFTSRVTDGNDHHYYTIHYIVQ